MTITTSNVPPSTQPGPAGFATGELSDWVNRIRSGSGTAAKQTPHQRFGNLETSTDFEEEVRKSRLERQKLRSRLSGHGVRGFTPHSEVPQKLVPSHTGPNPGDAVSREVTLRRLMSMRSPNTEEHSEKAQVSDAPRRGAALLARYGGAAGPTGTADPGSGQAPVSLASFMGSKATGPRLGKLAGDGRSAPPEVGLIDQSRFKQGGNPLPGMVPQDRAAGSGPSLASFLQERAQEQGAAASGHNISPRLQTGPSIDAAPGRSTSPERASPAQSSSPQRASQVVDAQRLSPVRRSTSPTKTQPSPDKNSFVRPAQPIAAAANQLRPTISRNGSSQTSMKHASTSPIRQEDIAAGGCKSITPSSGAPSPSRPDKPSATSGGPTYSPAFASLHRAGSVDRQPTASLTRLKGKGMVGQRLKEAKEREEQYAAASDGSAGAPPSRITIPRFQSHDGPSKSKVPSEVGRSTPQSPSSERRWSPQKFGNALHGLPKAAASPATPESPLTGSLSSSPGKARDADAKPVRLPGLGSATSPFGPPEGHLPTRTARAEGVAGSIAAEGTRGDATEESQPLQSLTKARAHGPARRSARTLPSQADSQSSHQESMAVDNISGKAQRSMPSDTSESTAAVAPAPDMADKQPVQPARPLRSTSGPRIAVLISGSGSNLQALIDATQVEEPRGPLAHAQICFVLSNRKAAFGLTRAATSNPPIPTHILALKTWQNRNPGGTREQYDEVLAKAVLQAEGDGTLSPPDMIVLAGFMHIVSPIFLRALGHDTDLPAVEAPSWRPAAPVPIINLHPALPKAFDGANAIPRAFEAFQKGEVDRTGIMVHEVVAEVDRGAPILVREVPISQTDTLDSLEDKMHRIEHQIIVEATGVMLERLRQGKTQTQAVAVPSRSEAKSQRTSVAKSAQVEAAVADSSSARATSLTDSQPRPSPRGSVSASPRPQGSAGPVQIACTETTGSPPSLSSDVAAMICAEPAKSSADKKTVSLETLLVHRDGTTSVLPANEAHILYDGEVQAVVHRYKSPPSAETVQTKLFARFGAQSALGGQANSHASASKEGRKLADLAIRYNTHTIDARQGREPSELATLFPDCVLETRQGSSRKDWDKGDAMLWRVSCPDATSTITFVDQVHLSASSLASTSSFILSVIGKVFLWYGHGSTDAERAAARKFAHSQLGAKGIDIAEMTEGAERGMWWDVLGSQGAAAAYAGAWHHRRRRLHSALGTASLRPRLFVVSRRGTGLDEIKGGDGEPCFTSSDVPLAGVSVVLLPCSEIYVLVGPEARSKRKEINLGLAVADRMATDRQLPVHVVVYPSLTPRDLDKSVRYWSAYASGLHGSSRRLNVVTLAQARREMAYLASGRGQVAAALVADRDTLPVGVGEADIVS